jgi:hypothetical protein
MALQLPHDGSILFETNGPGRETAIGALNNIILRLLATTPPGKLSFTIIDPVGFALENFDAVGRWRDHDGDNGPVDVAGGLPGVGEFHGVAGLQAGLLSRPELFAGRVTEKLLTFALGRGVEYYDAPVIRKIVREAASEDFRLSSLLLGIVKSQPFQMRTSI